MLMSIGIVAIILGAMTTMMETSFKGDKHVKNNLTIRELQNEVNESLKLEDNCGLPDLTGGVAVSGWTQTQNYPLNGGISGRFLTITKDNIYSRAIKITNISIGPYVNKITNVIGYIPIDTEDLATAGRIKASINVAMETVSQDTFVPHKAPLNFPVYLTVSGGMITGCNTEDTVNSTAKVCEMMGGTWNEEDQNCQMNCPEGFSMVGNACKADDDMEGQTCIATDGCDVSANYIF